MNAETAPADTVKNALKAEAARLEAYLAHCLDAPGTPAGLREAMEYSLLAGGKRVRPGLCLIASRLYGLTGDTAMSFAAALECIHTYSLIHDDLPAMDDDDLRRGRPSCHKRFDEATAILAGDGLLTDAFTLMAGTPGIPAERVLVAVALVARAAGSPGMVGGQYLDMQYTAKGSVPLEQLAAMHAMKTGALLRVPCEVGAVLAGAGGEEVERMSRYGAAMGAAFQIADDILDEIGDEKTLGKPVGSDAANGKITYPSLLGLEQSRNAAKAKADEAVAALDGLGAPEAALLRGLAHYIVNRVS